MLNVDSENLKVLKCLPKFFKAVKEGRKTFEVRHNDRNFRKGDTIILLEYDSEKNKYTGDVVLFEHIQTIDYTIEGLKSGYCVFSDDEIDFDILEYDPEYLKIGAKYVDALEREKEIKYILSYLDFPEGIEEGFCIISF